MSTISERARATIVPTPLPIDRTNRDHLREVWRLAALQWSAAEDNASRLEEGRKLILADAILSMKEGADKMSDAQADRLARTTDQFRSYLRKMHDARRAANDLKIEAENANRIYWENVTVEANERVERRMSR